MRVKDREILKHIDKYLNIDLYTNVDQFQNIYGINSCLTTVFPY